MEYVTAEEIWKDLIVKENYSAKIQIPPEVIWKLFKHSLEPARMIIDGQEAFFRSQDLERIIKARCEYYAIWGNDLCTETGFCISFVMHGDQEVLLQCPLKKLKEFTNYFLTNSGLKKFYLDEPKAQDWFH